MKSSHIAASIAGCLLSGGLLFSSCHPLPTPCTGGGRCQGEPRPPARVKAVVKLEKGKVPNAFYTAIDPSGRCAAITGSGGTWMGRVLFPRPQGAYCGYVWQSDPLAPPEPAALALASAGLTDLRVDPPALSVQQARATGDAGAQSRSRYELTRKRLGDQFDVPRPPQVGSVRVAVIDTTASDFYSASAERGHGRSVGKLIENVACSGVPGCRVEIKNYAALTLVTSRDRVVEAHGGDAGAYGTRAELAEKIETASREFQNERSAGTGPDHLVMNLSLGWSGCWNPEPLRADADPVYQAILRASCQGAIVVGAGGNVDAIEGCPDASGHKGPGQHVFPAQFANAHKPLDPEMCRSVGIEVKSGATLGPLMLGISAVDGGDKNLSIAAQQATLVAFGDAVSVPDGSGFTRPLSGTSMSAATVSGIAAALWASFPKSSAADVQRSLVEPAVQLGARQPNQRDFICNLQPTGLSPSECESVRRASLCRSLSHAQQMSSACGPAAFELTPVSEPPLPPDESEADACVAGTPAPAPACAPADPNAVDSAEQPWAIVGPQPEGDSCGTCEYAIGAKRFVGHFNSGGTFDGSIDGLLEIDAGSFALWGDPIGLSLRKRIRTSSPGTQDATLVYIRSSPDGNIYFRENVTVRD